MRPPTRTALRKLGIVTDVRTRDPHVEGAAEMKRERRRARNLADVMPPPAISPRLRSARMRNHTSAEAARERRQEAEMARLADDDCQARATA